VIPHGLFIAKLQAYGFSLLSCEMLLSYLNNRKQRVKLGDVYSDWVSPKKGVPQGSILGPLIFNIYMNDFFNVTLKSQRGRPRHFNQFRFQFLQSHTVSTAYRNIMS